MVWQRGEMAARRVRLERRLAMMDEVIWDAEGPTVFSVRAETVRERIARVTGRLEREMEWVDDNGG